MSIDDFAAGDLPGDPSVPERVITYLYHQRDKAFTRSEIAAALEADPNTVGTALSRLKERRLVRHKGEYWAVTADHDRIAGAYDLHTATDRLDDADGGIDPEEWAAAAPDTSHPSDRATDEDA